MDLLTRLPAPPLTDPLKADIARVVAIWKDARERFGSGGALLFGAFTCADAMFAPVATRFRTYGIDHAQFGDDGSAADYANAVLALPAMDDWTQGAKAEVEHHAA